MYPSVSNDVHAVVVTFHPDFEALRVLLLSLEAQTAGIVVVDNTPATAMGARTVCREQPFSGVRLIELGENRGIAHALNAGIKAALEAGATHILLSDQDSLPASDMVESLVNAEADLIAKARSPGAVGPTFTDRHTGITFPFQTAVPGKFFYGHQLADKQHPIVEAITLISSGTLIRSTVLQRVGMMREDFFIDHVDIEWCHRARANGYSLYGTRKAVMYHSFGDGALRVWYFGWRRESAYPPNRIYYRVRNFIALCRMPIIENKWKIRNAWYSLGLVYSQVVFGQDKIRTLKMAILGLYDGLRGRMGPLRWRL